MKERWRKAPFLIAMPSGAVQRRGRVYNGLGLFMISGASPKGRRKATWGLTHLGSGHGVLFIKADETAAYAIATEIAEAGDWTFEGLQGWRNQFPNAPDRIKSRYPDALPFHPGGGMNEATAQAIAAAA